MSKKQLSIGDELRRAIRQAEKAGTTRYRLAKATGLTSGALSRFMAGDRAPTLDTAARIARGLGKRLALVDS